MSKLEKGIYLITSCFSNNSEPLVATLLNSGANKYA